MPSGVYERKGEILRTTTGDVPTCPEEIIVEHKELARARNLMGWTDKMDRMYGEGEWGDEELKKDIRQTKWDKFTGGKMEPVRDVDVDSCMRGYLESFDNVTPNDEQSLYHLCTLELQFQRNARKLASPKKGTKMKDIKMLSDIQSGITREHRLLQQSLGISRRKRRAKKAKAFDAVTEQIDQAREWVEEQLIRVEHCDTQLGFVLYHFEELPHRFEFRCPKCKELVLVEGGDENNLDLVSKGL